MATFKHIDEALSELQVLAKQWIQVPAVERMIIIHDVYGLFRIKLWASPGELRDAAVAQIQKDSEQLGDYFHSSPELYDESCGITDREIFNEIWQESSQITDKLRINDRHRNRSGWFVRPREALWPVYADESPLPYEREPPIIVFLSHKGGVGRTTALASFALQKARAGDKVCVIDLDLDAPGIGTLLSDTSEAGTAPWGVVDYFLECKISDPNLDDYMHLYRDERTTADGPPIYVIPAGRMNEHYLSKLSRIDLEPAAPEEKHPLEELLQAVRSTLQPDWILIDSRAGLSPAAGLLLSGFAHLYVLFGTTSEQSFQGLIPLVRRLGHDRLKYGMLQGDCLMVQAMIPEDPEVARMSKRLFDGKIEDIFTEYYLADSGDTNNERWSLDDLDNDSAPHKPIGIPYRTPMGFFKTLDDIAPLLCTEDPYRQLAQRIGDRFPSVGEKRGFDEENA